MRVLSVFLIFLSSASYGLSQTGWNLLSHRSLGPTCNSIRNLRVDPPCNPAFLGQSSHGHDLDHDHDNDSMKEKDEKEGLLAAQIMLGDNYNYLYKNRDLFNDRDKKDLIADLLSQKEPVGFDGGLQLWWKQQSFVIAVEPLRLHYYSEVVNSAYPDLMMEAISEQGLIFQIGKEFSNPSHGSYNSHNSHDNQDSSNETNSGKTYLGLEVRLLDRQVIYERFYLFDALPHLDDYFQTQHQKAILIEPGFVWDLADSDSQWNPLFSLKISQIGYVDKKIESSPLKAIVDVGASVAPTALSKQFEIGLNYRANSDNDFLDNFSAATSFSFSILQLYLSVEKDTQSVGLSSRFRNWSSGLIYQKTKSLLEKTSREISFLEFRILI